MDPLEMLLVVAFGVTGGLAAGALGIGGGTLFIPAMVFVLDQSLLKAEGTALLAIAVVCVVGAWRQDGYGNVRLFDALAIGLLSPLGVVVGAGVANRVPERTLELGLAALFVYFGIRLVRRALPPPAAARASTPRIRPRARHRRGGTSFAGAHPARAGIVDRRTHR